MIDAPSSAWFTAHPEWHWLVVLYFFFGGLAGGCYVLAAVIDLFGRERDRPLARVGYLTVLASLAVSALALVVDLSRPDRFYHLLVEIHTWMPLFQWWTPMNLAAWVLLAFGLCAVLSALGVRPPGVPGTVVSVVGALLGLYVASYEGMLLAFTSRPIWSETPLIGPVLVLTALSMAAAYLVLFARWRGWDLPGLRALQRIDAQALNCALRKISARMDERAEPYEPRIARQPFLITKVDLLHDHRDLQQPIRKIKNGIIDAPASASGVVLEQLSTRETSGQAR